MIELISDPVPINITYPNCLEDKKDREDKGGYIIYIHLHSYVDSLRNSFFSEYRTLQIIVCRQPVLIEQPIFVFNSFRSIPCVTCPIPDL